MTGRHHPFAAVHDSGGSAWFSGPSSLAGESQTRSPALGRRFWPSQFRQLGETVFRWPLAGVRLPWVQSRLHQAGNPRLMTGALALRVERHPAQRAVALKYTVLVPKRFYVVERQPYRSLNACAVIWMKAHHRALELAADGRRNRLTKLLHKNG